MTEFANAKIIKKANVYFDGKVTSRTVILENGEKRTLGIMMPGDYEFATDAKEIMEVLGGSMTVLLPGSDDWQTFAEGQSYEVPASSSFKLKIPEVADYCCTYIES